MHVPSPEAVPNHRAWGASSRGLLLLQALTALRKTTGLAGPGPRLNAGHTRGLGRHHLIFVGKQVTLLSSRAPQKEGSSRELQRRIEAKGRTRASLCSYEVGRREQAGKSLILELRALLASRGGARRLSHQEREGQAMAGREQ